MERKPAKICRACEPCRRRKVRCNGGTPCQHPGCQSNPVECRYRIKARNRISLKRSAEPSKEASGLPAVPPSSSLATAIEDAPSLLPVDDGQLQTRNGLCTLPSAPSDVAVPCPMSPEQSVYDSITATHHAPTATDSSQLFYGPSSNFAFLHQVHRGTLQNVPVTDLFRRRDVQEGGPGLDMFMQRTLFFGTPSRVSADVIWPASCLQQIPRDVAEVYLGHFKTVYLARFPFFTPSELDLLFDDFYTVERESEKSMLLPQTKAGILAALALGALCTPQTNTAETLLMQSKSQVMMYDDAVTLQMLQLSLLSSEYQLQMGRLNSAYLHLGAACRKAFALGLHKETNATSDSQDALRRQRATIWTLYCHETWLSLVLGRKSSLKVADISWSMPKEHTLLFSLSQLSVIAENAAETIYGCRSVSLLQLYEKSEKVHVQLRQFAEQFGIASATTGHNKSIFDDASSILLHNWYYHIVTLAFRPFLVADSALRSSEMVPHDDEMWLRHACRSAVSAAQDSIAFTSSMFRKPNAVAPSMRYCTYFFDSACSILMHDTLYHPSKYPYNLEYIHDALGCFGMMVQDEPMTAASGSIQKILQAVEETINTRQVQQLSILNKRALANAPTSHRLPIGANECIMFSDHPSSHLKEPSGSSTETRGHNSLSTEHETTVRNEAETALPLNHFSNLDLDILTTDLLNFFPVDITTPESSASALFST